MTLAIGSAGSGGYHRLAPNFKLQEKSNDHYHPRRANFSRPNGRIIIVKVLTSEPGLYGLGCATFTQRCAAVHAALESHVKPFVLGKDVSRIEELFQMNLVQGYWRNGPVLNNAISRIDQAL